jgi:hypothetical protein
MDKKDGIIGFIWDSRYFTYDQESRQLCAYKNATCSESVCLDKITLSRIEDVHDRPGKRPNRFDAHGVSSNSSGNSVIFQVSAVSETSKKVWMEVLQGNKASAELHKQQTGSAGTQKSSSVNITQIKSSNVGKYVVGAKVNGMAKDSVEGIIVAVHSDDNSGTGQ